MPKILEYKEISDKKYILEKTEIKAIEDSSKIQVPIKIGRKLKGKTVKVTIEVIE